MNGSQIIGREWFSGYRMPMVPRLKEGEQMVPKVTGRQWFPNTNTNTNNLLIIYPECRKWMFPRVLGLDGS